MLSMNLDEFVSPVSLAQLELKSPLSCRDVLAHLSYLLNEAEKKKIYGSSPVDFQRTIQADCPRLVFTVCR